MRRSGAGMPTSARSSIARLRAAAAERGSVGPDRLDELLADPVERVQAGQRVLEDHADALAAHLPHLLGRQVVDALAREADLAARDAARRIDQADHRRAGHRLAGAGLADDAQDLASGDVERDAVDRLQHAAAGDELDPEVADGEDGRTACGSIEQHGLTSSSCLDLANGQRHLGVMPRRRSRRKALRLSLESLTPLAHPEGHLRASANIERNSGRHFADRWKDGPDEPVSPCATFQRRLVVASAPRRTDRVHLRQRQRVNKRYVSILFRARLPASRGASRLE